MKYKKRAECSIELQKLIDLVNVLPKGVELPNPFEISKEIEIDKGIENTEEALYQKTVKANNVWFEKIKKIPGIRDFEKLHEFLTTLRPDLEPNKWNIAGDVFNGYGRFNDVRKIFDQVLELTKLHKAAYERIGENVYSWQEFSIGNIGFVTLFANGKDGEISFGIPKVLEHFKGCELTRFKRCVICERIFYAKKTNAETCQPQCAKTLFNRKRLAKIKNEKVEKELQRKKWLNQDFNKKGRKNNGTL